ncbi:hypothetical protein OTU49_001377 [Cherax quadricarinatus]|uniref:Uncharacterized protein n=1 Tax=Cherax quadricarinatus TaxID=27406 RepID=A0AAW0XZD8_CHEQU
MESTPSVNAFPSSTSTEGHVGGSSALYVVTPVEDFNSSTSIRMPQTSTSSIGNTENSVENGNSEDVYNTDDALTESDSHGKVSPVIDRGWRRTSQVMPSIEEFGDFFISRLQKDHEPISSKQNSMIGRTSYSVLHEASDRYSVLNSAVSNMDKQGNKRTSPGFKINTPREEKH